MNVDSLYSIESRERHADEIEYHLRLDATHPVYRAHFPDEPVTPGVCLVRMAVELLGDAIGRRVRLSVLRNAKFLSVLSPIETPEVECVVRKISMDGEEVSGTSEIRSKESVIARISLICHIF